MTIRFLATTGIFEYNYGVLHYHIYQAAMKFLLSTFENNIIMLHERMNVTL